MIKTNSLSNGALAVAFIIAIAGLLFSGPWLVRQAATVDAYELAYNEVANIKSRHSLAGQVVQSNQTWFDRIVKSITTHKQAGQSGRFGELVQLNRSINFGEVNNYSVYSHTGEMLLREGNATAKQSGVSEHQSKRNQVFATGKAQMIHTSQSSGFQVRSIFIPLKQDETVTNIVQIEVLSKSSEILVSKTIQAALWISCIYIATLFLALFALFSRNLRNKLKAEEEAHFLSRFDRLTSLYNRKSFEEEVSSKKIDQEHAMLVIDVDDFKVFNDRYGHLAGDAVLNHVANSIKAVFNEATLCRWAGDEFIIMTNAVGNNIVLQRRINELQEIVSKKIEHEGNSISCSISIGVYINAWNGNLNEFIHKADAALYAAKTEPGKGHASFYTPQIDAQRQRIENISKRLETALEDDALHLVFQPQFDAIASELKGFEALLRWEDAELGNVSPAEFIPIAEEAGFIVDIGSWVLREACKKAISWPNDIKISVNVSAVQFEHPDFITILRQALYHSGLDPQRLEIELTETALLDSTDLVLQTVTEISKLGVSIAMDDFGTGHSTLTYLATLPVSKIKIDRSFVSKVGDKGRNDAIINAIVGLADRMDLSIIAEGVETREQKNLIVDMGCSEIQGFLYGKPTKDPFGEESSVHELIDSAKKAFNTAS